MYGLRENLRLDLAFVHIVDTRRLEGLIHSCRRDSQEVGLTEVGCGICHFGSLVWIEGLIWNERRSSGIERKGAHLYLDLS